MLSVMQDESVDPLRRDRMAIAAAPFVHRRADDVGKKAQAERDAETVHAGSRWEYLVNRGREPAKPVQPDWSTGYTWPGPVDDE
jgi:hypothetical protein